MKFLAGLLLAAVATVTRAGEPPGCGWDGEECAGVCDRGYECVEFSEESCRCEVVMFVTLDSFTAEVVSEGVMLRWTTTTEVDNMGFRLLRARQARAKDGVGVELDVVAPELILPLGGALHGASYEYLDRSPEARGATYFLEDVDVRGRASVHGPAIVEPKPATRMRR